MHLNSHSKLCFTRSPPSLINLASTPSMPMWSKTLSPHAGRTLHIEACLSQKTSESRQAERSFHFLTSKISSVFPACSRLSTPLLRSRQWPGSKSAMARLSSKPVHHVDIFSYDQIVPRCAKSRKSSRIGHSCADLDDCHRSSTLTWVRANSRRSEDIDQLHWRRQNLGSCVSTQSWLSGA